MISSSFKSDINELFFTQNQFSTSAVNTKTFILMLANNNPKSFISGGTVDLKKALKGASNREFHHIFPNKYLQTLGKAKKNIFMLSNFCFLNNADNQRIKDKAPKDYKNLINKGSIDEIMKSALCPINTLDLIYEEFTEQRTKLLLEFANNLIK